MTEVTAHNPATARRRYWRLGNELYQLLHRWPQMLLAVALGCALGWAAARFWPPTYQASTRIYVGLNPYRTYSDSRFLALARPKYSNLDNYHYWQMSQLDAALFSSEMISTTLAALQAQDPQWQGVSAEELQGMLDATWRSSGNWDLSAQHARSEQAQQASLAWSAAAVAQTRDAVAAARQVIALDDEIQATSQQTVTIQQRLAALEAGSLALQDWQHEAAGRSPAEPAPVEEHWRLQAVISQMSAGPFSGPAGWAGVLTSHPPAGAPLSAYHAWVSQALAQAQAETESLQAQLAALQAQQQTLAERYAVLSERSLGFSPNLEFEDPRPQPIEALQPTGTLILGGGIIGLMAWLIIQLARVRVPDEKPEGSPASSAGVPGQSDQEAERP